MSGVSRRQLFGLFTRSLREKAPVAARAIAAPFMGGAATPAAGSPDLSRIAVVQGRHCLALTSGCSVCVDKCPVRGALLFDAGLPMVVADTCNGCGICHDVCPAPTNAVLLLPRRQTDPLPAD